MIKQITGLFTALGLATGLTAATISFSPTSQTVAQGSTVTVDVMVSGLALNQVIGGFDLTVLSDASIVNNTAVTFLNALGDPALELTGSSLGTGSVNASEVSLETNATLAGLQTTQPFSIFEITYLAVGPGTSPLDFALTPRDLSDGDGNLLPDTALTFETGSITVSGGTTPGIPEPATLALFCLGIAFAAVAHRRGHSGKA